MNALVTDNISVKFGELVALNEVSLAIEEGERKGILGPNGAGKTTLFNVICGDILPSSGEVYLFDQRITTLSPHRRVSLGMGRTFQRINAFIELTVTENMSLALGEKRLSFGTFRMEKNSLGMKGIELLQKIGLVEKKDVLVKNLSYGEQRIVEILLAVSLEPKILLLDEPTAGLSLSEVSIISGMIKELATDITTVVIEHDMDVIFDITDRITVLHHGRVIADGANEDIKKDEQVREIYLGGAIE